MRMLHTFGLIVLSLATTLTASAIPQKAEKGARRSLEEILAVERAAAKAKRDSLRPEVSRLLADMRKLSSSKSGDSRTLILRKQLVALGAPISPLLIEVLNPPMDASTVDLSQALFAASVLEEIPLEAVIDDLIELAQSGTPRGRNLSIRVLGSSASPVSVGPILAHIFFNEQALRVPALRSLSRLGGPDADRALTAVLTMARASSGGQEQNTQLIAEALAALAEAVRLGQPVTQGQLVFLHDVLDSDLGRRLLRDVVDFVSVLAPGILSADHTRLLIALATNRLVANKERIFILDALPDIEIAYERSMQGFFEGVLADENKKVVEAALICLARLGDKSAKKKLLKPLKERITKKRNLALAYEERGAIQIRLRDFDAAISDYKKAIKLYDQNSENPNQGRSAYTNLARSQCLKGDARGAAKTLSSSTLSTVQLRALAKDPDFAVLVADKKYRKSLRL